MRASSDPMTTAVRVPRITTHGEALDGAAVVLQNVSQMTGRIRARAH